MALASDRLEEARAAYERRDWLTARDAYRAASEAGPLPIADRYALSQCWWWLGDIDECNRHLEAVHHQAREEEPETAAKAALELGIAHLLRGDEPVGSGWVGRATRLAESVPGGAIHGYLALVAEVDADFGDAEPSRVADAARRVRDIGRRCGDLTLVASALNGEGRALIKAGRVAEGMGLLDEAMVAVLAGEVADKWAGNVYCNTIEACHELGEFGRMARWTEAMEQWLDTLPPVPYAGDCRVHRAQLLTLSGDWERAEQEATRVCEELAGVSVVNVAEAWYEVGEVRRRRGDLPGAEEAYGQAHGHGLDPQPGLALLRLAQGRVATAAAAIRSALLATSEDRVTRARLCAAQVEIAVAADQLDAARQVSDELEVIAGLCGSPGLASMAARSRGAVLLAEGRPGQALAPLREACRSWRELDAPYEAARTGLILARAYDALGDDEAAGRELDAAVTVFDRLGAHADVAQVARMRGAEPRPAGLSAREVEVLRLVAGGRSNQEIADALSISRKTVARHMSNIFAKLGASSRLEAARFAFDHGLQRFHD